MLAVGLDMAQIEAKTLCHIQNITEVQTYGIKQHRGHADFIQSPHIMATS